MDTNTYQVQLATSATAAPAPGMRRVLIAYRAPAGKQKPQNKVVDVPVLTFAAAADQPLNMLVTELLQDVQDSMIRSRIPESDSNLPRLTDADVSMAAILAYGQQVAASKRLSKDSISTYYDAHLMDAVIVRFLAATEVDTIADLSQSQSEQLQKLLAASKEAYCKLAAVSPAINAATAKQLLGLLQFAEPPADDAITVALTSKLQSIANPPATDELLAML